MNQEKLADDSYTTAEILRILADGEIQMEGLVAWGSNYTFLVRISHNNGNVDAVYKPSRGERPLWDFARGTLCLRERAAFLASEAIGWHIVPPTILRNGPHGWGSLQYFVKHDPDEHYLTLREDFASQTQRIALFDTIINNADRKSGHVLLGNKRRLWAIDHGVCFHSEYKLRSVIWDFAGQPIPQDILRELMEFDQWLCNGDDSVFEELKQLLEPQELSAMQSRLQQLIKFRTFPQPGPGRHYPWPLV